MQAVAHFIDTFVPEHYDLFLDLNRSSKTFSGKVIISGEPKGFDHRNSRSTRSSPSIYGR